MAATGGECSLGGRCMGPRCTEWSMCRGMVGMPLKVLGSISSPATRLTLTLAQFLISDPVPDRNPNSNPSSLIS